jgi:hypothetical protein
MAQRINRFGRAFATTLLVFFATGATWDDSYVGIQGLALVGVHRDVTGSEYGIGGGPLLELHVGGPRFAVHLEGIPVVSIPGVRPSVAYGQATPAIGIFNGDAEYAIAARGQLWLGFGETIYNQRTPLPAQAQEVSSRLAGARYTLRFKHPFGTAHFLEAFVGAAPYLTGSDVYAYLDGAPDSIRPERASEVDASLEFGYTRNRSQWLIGIRSLNFTAMYPLTGEAADRNVGIGPLIEWRTKI